jgi:transcriptional antiterminator RfaH
VSTHPSAEFKACVNLERQGWDTFCPAIAKTIKSGRRVRTELRPLFPGYALVALDTARDAWRSVNGTIGVRQLVHFGSDPSPLPTGVVEALQAMSDDHGRVDFSRQLEVGGKVRFLAGPFAEMIGSLEHLDGRGRVRVFLTLFGRETEVKAHARDVIPMRDT